jgi:transcriptional regulator with XRE-family HTH domain
MHEYRRLVEEQMAAKKIEGYGAQAKLASLAGVSRQVINTILRDNRDRLNQAPDEKTVNGLAAAFNLKPEVVWTAVAVSMGMPSYVVPTITHEVKAATNEDLLNELADRLGVAPALRPAGPPASEDQKTLTEGTALKARKSSSNT